MLNRKQAIDLLNTQNCVVKVGGLAVYSKLKPYEIGIFTTEKGITEYGTIFIKELNAYEVIERIFEINGEEINWRKELWL